MDHNPQEDYTADIATKVPFFRGYKPWFSRWFKKDEQKTYCYCPSCMNDLCSNGSFVEDTDLVRYQCKVCGKKSEWNFDIAPVPVLKSVNGGVKDGVRL